jgi:hypothetical protein
MLVPKEMKVEHSGGVKGLTDERLDDAITALREMLARQAGEAVKVIEREAEVLPALPTPALHSRARPCGGLQVFARPTTPTQGRGTFGFLKICGAGDARDGIAKLRLGTFPDREMRPAIRGSEFGGPQGPAKTAEAKPACRGA